MVYQIITPNNSKWSITIDSVTYDVFASVSQYSALSGINRETILHRFREIMWEGAHRSKMISINTNNNCVVRLITIGVIIEWLAKDNPGKINEFMNQWKHAILKTKLEKTIKIMT